MFERSCANDDVFPCPKCGVDTELRIRFHEDAGSFGHEQTDIFCIKCGNCFSAAESRWAYADWNWWALCGWKAQGKSFEIASLYSLLKEEADIQRSFQAQQNDIKQRLAISLQQFSPCPWKVGSRFRSTRWPVGIWETTRTEIIYAINTGPMWLVHATEVKISGFLGERSHTFPGHDADQMQSLPPFWRPMRWSQVVVGDECYYNLVLGRITASNQHTKQANIQLRNGAAVEVRTLKTLEVPLIRFQQYLT